MVNRIIGILVLLAIGVLLSPFFATHSTQSFLTEAIKEPPFPDQFAQSDTIRALRDHNNWLNREKAKLSLLKYPSLKHNLTIHEITHTTTQETAWVIQVGAFKNKIDAFRLVNKLRSRGYNAFIHQKNAAFGAETKVYIGPENKRNSAESLASKLSKEDRISGVITSFKPLAS